MNSLQRWRVFSRDVHTPRGLRLLAQSLDLEYIGAGTNRVVYALGDGNVVKIAKNALGRAANLALSPGEHYYDPIFPKLIARHEDGHWLVVPRFRKARTADWQRITGLKIGEAISHLHNLAMWGAGGHRSARPQQPDPDTHEVMYTIDTVLADFIGPEYTHPGDFARASSWGVNDENDALVLLDEGALLTRYDE